MKRTHGMSGTKIYRVWCAMLARCRNPNDPDFKDYGARGITVCAEWLSFDRFFADMGEAPKGMTLDRRENDLGYSAANCRWATRSEQRANQRRRRDTANGIEGVKWSAAHRAFRAYGRHAKHLGLRKDFFEACCLRKSYEARAL